MKTTFISTSALSQSLRHHLMRMQTELADRQQEVVTGRVADPGVTLGERSSRNISMQRDIERLEGMKDSNTLAANRLDVSQAAMSEISTLGEQLLSALTAGRGSSAHTVVVKAEAQRSLESITNLLNTNLNGEYLFSGIDTDVRPFNDFTDPASPNKAAFDTAFSNYFGFPQDDPQAAGITAADMQTFLKDEVEPLFLGTGWQGTWSNGSDQAIVSRIALNEKVETSLTANSTGIRKMAMAMASVSELLGGPLNDEAREALYERATSLVGEAIAEIANTQAQAGIAETRIEAANERISAQTNLFKGFINDMEKVDPYEAATRVSDLVSQIENSYALTARIQQLSLLRFLR